MGIVAVCVCLLCARVLRSGRVVCEWNACWRVGAANSIGAEGAQALAASLEKNTALTTLELGCTRWCSVWRVDTVQGEGRVCAWCCVGPRSEGRQLGIVAVCVLLLCARVLRPGRVV